MKDSYQKEVIEVGDRASQLGKQICFDSHKNCPAVVVVPHQPGNFRGSVGFAWKKHVSKLLNDYFYVDGEFHWEMLMEMENDGAGGKPGFFALVGLPEVYFGLGWEIIAMTADDLARTGRFPAVMANELCAKKITDQNYHLFEAAMYGYGAALKAANLVNITGETAIMKHSITGFADTGADDQLLLTWGGTCIGLNYHQFYVDGFEIQPDMPIVGIWEPGYRCNGGTRLTELLFEVWGTLDSIMKSPEARGLIRKFCLHSISSAKTTCRLIGWNEDASIGIPKAKIKGIANITGGGLWQKLGDVLPKGIGAVLDTMPLPTPILLEVQRFSQQTDNPISDWQCHSTFHGGCGTMYVLEDDESVDVVISEVIRDGMQAYKIGRTTASADNEIIVQSKFFQRRLLSSLHPE